jgi:hypothetical protein
VEVLDLRNRLLGPGKTAEEEMLDIRASNTRLLQPRYPKVVQCSSAVHTCVPCSCVPHCCG